MCADHISLFTSSLRITRISNLCLLAKLTERIILARLNNYLYSNTLFNSHHSTKPYLPICTIS